MRLRVLQRDHYRCHSCGGRANQVDHVIPITAGGSRLDPRNLIASCLRCNVRRARDREQLEGRRGESGQHLDLSGAEVCSGLGGSSICRRNRPLAPQTDDAEKLRG